jgi:hypothetical protein
MVFTIHPNFQKDRKKLSDFIIDFESTGKPFGDGKRNKIKLFQLDNLVVNIKSFKIPNHINKVAYRFFRKSKADRSYEYANMLLENNIGTPRPIAFFETFSLVGFKNSYYISEHLQTELTFRELVENPEYPNHEIILRAFINFSFNLHQKGIEFLDHSPGNTLINPNKNGGYDFYLVDLNRMSFHKTMSFDLRMKNLSRLTPKNEMLLIMSDEYAKLYGKSAAEVYQKMSYYTHLFQEKYHRKQRLKKQLFFWR